MKIQGLQKLTLLDYPGKLGCTIFTAGCNFRCPFCHNAALVTRIEDENDIPTEEVLAFLKKRKGMLEGVCISGGEPLLQEDIVDFIQQVKRLGYLVKLDTNGSDGDKLKTLVEEKWIDYVAMDIKNAPERYGETIGIQNAPIEQVLASVDFLLKDKVDYEFRTTVVREFHTREDIAEIGRWITGAKRYFLQKFEDSGDLIGIGCRTYSDEIMQQALGIVQEYVPNAQLRGIG